MHLVRLLATKTGGHDSYSNSIAVMALLTAFPSGENADSVIIDHGPFNGQSYRQLAQECIELLMWSQGDGSVRGGWGILPLVKIKEGTMVPSSNGL